MEDDAGGGSGYRGSGGAGRGGGYQGGRGGFGGPRGRGGFGGPRPFRPSPVKVGEEYDVKIDSLSRRGDSGVARIQGLVVFVANSKVGDAVRVRITKVGNGYATAEVVSGGGGGDSSNGSGSAANAADQQAAAAPAEKEGTAMPPSDDYGDAGDDGEEFDEGEGEEGEEREEK